MKEDILEQLVEDWLVAKEGCFVKHNIRYRPDKSHPDYESKKDSVHSDIDILAYFCTEKDPVSKVCAVTCKSWQGGFNLKYWKDVLEATPKYNQKTSEPREKWKYFREITSDKWIEAFLNQIEEETGQRDFTYYIAVTKTIGDNSDKEGLEQSKVIQERFLQKNSRIKIKVVELKDILEDYKKRLQEKDTPALESTEVGRLLQLIYAADMDVK
ncbi:MAG: hypothetical protein H0Z33_14585 [Bacillaceae bacterium]|nr:hypothetical protein [Bacillaceae bacterium]